VQFSREICFSVNKRCSPIPFKYLAGVNVVLNLALRMALPRAHSAWTPTKQRVLSVYMRAGANLRAGYLKLRRLRTERTISRADSRAQPCSHSAA
jgi:hypothetical protein